MLQAAKQVASIQNIVICFEELLFLITSFCYLQFSTKQKNRRSLGGCFHQKEGNSEKQGPDQSTGGSTSVFWLTHKPTQKEMRGTRSHAARLNIIAEYQNLIAKLKLQGFWAETSKQNMDANLSQQPHGINSWENLIVNILKIKILVDSILCHLWPSFTDIL